MLMDLKSMISVLMGSDDLLKIPTLCFIFHPLEES